MTTEQLFIGGSIVVLVITVVVMGVSVYRKDTQNANLITLVSQTAERVAANPVWIENAKAVGQSVPQEAFNSLIQRFDSLEMLFGQTAALGIALQRIEDVVKKIDHDPANDPVPSEEAPPPA